MLTISTVAVREYLRDVARGGIRPHAQQAGEPTSERSGQLALDPVDGTGSLQQTASAMETLTLAVKDNASNARLATELAAEATKLATSGGQSVDRAVTTMESIRASSRKIVEIIGRLGRRMVCFFQHHRLNLRMLGQHVQHEGEIVTFADATVGEQRIGRRDVDAARVQRPARRDDLVSLGDERRPGIVTEIERLSRMEGEGGRRWRGEERHWIGSLLDQGPEADCDAQLVVENVGREAGRHLAECRSNARNVDQHATASNPMRCMISSSDIANAQNTRLPRKTIARLPLR